MDLPPLRIEARQQENYTSASGSGVTLPSLNPASTLRERRGLTLSSPIPPATGTTMGYAQEYNASEHGVVPRSALPLPPEHTLSGAGMPPSTTAAARPPYAPNATRSFGDR